MNRIRTVPFRALLATSLAAGILLASASSAFALQVGSVKYTNPVAYDIRSLQWTHFYTSVDTSGASATLSVATPKGPKVIFNGPLGAANTRFWFPAWNGHGPDGKLLPSARSYRWRLVVSTPPAWAGTAASRTASGTISVSRTYATWADGFSWLASAAPLPGPYHRMYQIAADVTCYIHATSSTLTTQDVQYWVDRGQFFGVDIPYPQGPIVPGRVRATLLEVGMGMPAKTAPLNDTLVLTHEMGQESPETAGIYSWRIGTMFSSGPPRRSAPSTYTPTGPKDAAYSMTVIQ